MEEWYKKVRLLKDESESAYLTELLCKKMFYDLKLLRVKDKGKFKQRMGPEFEVWVASLKPRFSSDMISAIISDDEFWDLTLKITLGV